MARHSSYVWSYQWYSAIAPGNKYLKKEKFKYPVKTPTELALFLGGSFVIGFVGVVFLKYHLPFTAYGVYIYYNNKRQESTSKERLTI